MTMTITAKQKQTSSTTEILKEAAARGALTVGCDLGDKVTQVCVLGSAGEVVLRQRVPTTPLAVERLFVQFPKARVALEVGTHSRWFSQKVASAGHEVIVANPRQLPLIYRSQSKTDLEDAEKLARLARVDPELLCPIKHRGDGVQADLTVIRSRDMLVRQRVSFIVHVRGIVKPLGLRISKCSTGCFVERAREELPASVLSAVHPILAIIRQLDRQIARYDKKIEERAKSTYPECARLEQVDGVGTLTALTFILAIEDKQRFKHSREVGPFLGLVPRKSQTGMSDPELRITKAGDTLLRRLLVQCAQRILGPFAKDSDLRRYGENIAGHGGKNAKKRAVVAVARKLGVLLHRLWVTNEPYQLLGYTPPAQRKAA